MSAENKRKGKKTLSKRVFYDDILAEESDKHLDELFDTFMKT